MTVPNPYIRAGWSLAAIEDKGRHIRGEILVERDALRVRALEYQLRDLQEAWRIRSAEHQATADRLTTPDFGNMPEGFKQ